MITAIALILISQISFADSSTEQIESLIDKRIEKILMDRPEIIINAIEEFQKREAQKSVDQAKNKIAENYKAMTNLENTPYIGNKNSQNILIEFSDYMCGYCKMFSKITKEIHEQNKDILIIFKETPILGENSKEAAKFAIAVNRLNSKKYMDFHSKLMEGNIRSKEELMATVKSIGMDEKSVDAEAQSAAVEKIIADNLELAQKIGLRGTPTFIFNGELVNQTLSNEYITSKLKK
jgi:protein-disulfide isomerase